MRNILKSNKNYSIIFSVTILFLTLFMSIGYASINPITLDIIGTVNAKAEGSVSITSVEYVSNSNADISSSTINNYYGTVLDSKIVLGDSSSSSITYSVTIENNSTKDYFFIGTVYDENFYDNLNIKFDLIGLEENDIISANDGRLTFTITFSYVDIDTTNNILNSYLNFKFGASHTVTYFGFEENTYPNFVIDGTTYINTFEPAPATIVITMGEVELTLDKYTYLNGTLTIPDVKGNLVISSYPLIDDKTYLTNSMNTLTEDGGTIILEREINLTDNFTLAFNSGGNVILDLNNHNFTATHIDNGGKLIQLSGNTNLTIRGSKSTILTNEIGIYMDSTFTGELRLEGVNLKVDYDESNSRNGDCAIRNAGTGKVYIINSRIESDRWAGINNMSGGYVYIENSTIIGDNYALKNEGAQSTMQIESGTFIANKQYYTSGQVIYNPNGVINIKTGIFNDTSFTNFITSEQTYIQNDDGYYVVE